MQRSPIEWCSMEFYENQLVSVILVMFIIKSCGRQTYAMCTPVAE